MFYCRHRHFRGTASIRSGTLHIVVSASVLARKVFLDLIEIVRKDCTKDLHLRIQTVAFADIHVR